jgi:hypothetical protein
MSGFSNMKQIRKLLAFVAGRPWEDYLKFYKCVWETGQREVNDILDVAERNARVEFIDFCQELPPSGRSELPYDDASLSSVDKGKLDSARKTNYFLCFGRQAVTEHQGFESQQTPSHKDWEILRMGICLPGAAST